MNLQFRLLVIDDNPPSVDSAVLLLSDRLESLGFELRRTNADDLTEPGLKALARGSGRDFDLVIIDYQLGTDTDGAAAAARFRIEMPFTDIIFYSTNESADLLGLLAMAQVAGVFVSGRTDLGDVLIGVSDTIIGKAVDLNHMRGIAMAQVAEMDVLMDDILERVFATGRADFAAKATETLVAVKTSAEASLSRLGPLVDGGNVLDVVSDSRLFSSAQKFMAIRRVAKCLAEKPLAALETLKSYETDVIKNRNTLAHAKDDLDADGCIYLRSVKRGEAPIEINDAWMVDFRGKLRRHRAAIIAVCEALERELAT